jgi:transcriptional regulator with XRE-family HTH domain
MPEPTDSPSAEISPDEDDLRLMMQRSGLTARALASRVGVSESALSRWVRGERNPMDTRVEALAQILGKTPAQIRRGFVVSQARYGRSTASPRDEQRSGESAKEAPGPPLQRSG